MENLRARAGEKSPFRYVDLMSLLMLALEGVGDVDRTIGCNRHVVAEIF